ncbi:NAD(P)-dependent oxidoreductase [Kaistia sp. 32K]|uniref:SDR family oxidoreductase n=1 Tax=Kaistia sp. 32K TaxID=2795690 RepID=UPI001938A946|nr:SDR family oxidoreductase [Kaistia sp. 32K]BCP55426.1 NAD(P)-dependent oxidoreductase [Kaistia sp. 32K]
MTGKAEGKILVLGATGNVGLPLVKALLAKGETVTAASRSGRPVEGAEGVVFDYADPATFGPALDGVDRAYILLPAGHVAAKELLLPVVEAAVARGVKIVFQSVFGAEADDAIPYRQVEIAIEKSGVPYVILRPNWFSDNFHTYWKAGVDHGQVAVPAADGKTSFVDVRDVAASAAAALTTDRFDGRAFNLTGPEGLDYTDATRILAGVLGKPVAYKAIDDEAFVSLVAGAGVAEDYARLLAAIFYPVREGWAAVVTGDVETLTGSAPRSVEAYARDNVAALTA